MILINITNINNIFYEIAKLNIAKMLPKQIQSIALPAINEYKIYLLGGVNSKSVHLFDRVNMGLIPQQPILSQNERYQFSLCHIRNS